MLNLGVIDHVRLNLDTAASNYTVHAKAAERLASLMSKGRIGVLAFLAIATALTMISVFEPRRPLQISAVIAVGVAFVAFASYLALGLEARERSHRSSAHHLWIVCDRHRALLAEIQDGLLDRATILQRSDELGTQVHGAPGQALPSGQIAYEGTRQAVENRNLSDRQLSPTPHESKEDDGDANGPVRH
jgi:conflict system pore-forming effector with SLATT domain